jgi:HEAT repeat protein
MIIFFTVVTFLLSAQEAEEPEAAVSETESEAPPDISEVDSWRETLLFGINETVIELLPQLTENREIELKSEVLELFERNNNRRVLQGALRYLEQLEITEGHPRAFQLLEEWFDRPPEVIAEVLSYLNATDAPLRDGDMDLLAEIARTTPVLRALGAVRLIAARAEDASLLMELYEDAATHEDVQGRILISLGERKDPDVFDFVMSILGDEEFAQTALQRSALDTLGQLEDPRGLPVILRQLDSSDAITRSHAISALARFSEEEAVRGIEMGLRDEFWRVRVASLQTVSEQNLDSALRNVMFMVRQDPERRVRMDAIRTLAALDHPDGWDLLHQRMKDRRVPVAERQLIIQVAMEHNTDAAIPVVMEIVEREWSEENSVLLDTIGRMVSRTESAALEELAGRFLEHSNFIIQIYGIRSAGLNGFRRYRERIEERKEAPHRAVQTAVSRALEQLQ